MTSQQTIVQTAAATIAPSQPATYGTSEEGNWNVYVPHDRTISWGPFPNKTEAVEFMVLVNPTRMFAVNLTDLPNFFNV
jgi:hypothetical protein